MGMERTVRFEGTPPSWQAIRAAIQERGLGVQLRMIDGMPAFPDECPEDGWRELRLSTPAGMMTLRLQSGSVSVVVWGNADDALLRERDTVVEACLSATGGKLTG